MFSLSFQVKRLQRWNYQSFGLNTLYGFTKNESTGEYLLVIPYYEYGNLRKQLRQEMNWNEKMEIIQTISDDIKDIHNAKMIHR